MPNRICINTECGWVGAEDDCLDYAHPTGARLCPECYEVTEEISTEVEKSYSTKVLIEKLANALENGYEELSETDIGELLIECETAQQSIHADAAPTDAAGDNQNG